VLGERFFGCLKKQICFSKDFAIIVIKIEDAIFFKKFFNQEQDCLKEQFS
jgi:hypothetical protein